MLSALQADSETSRSWHLFRELLPKAVTTCSDHNPNEWERWRGEIIYTVCKGRKHTQNAFKEAYSLLENEQQEERS